MSEPYHDAIIDDLASAQRQLAAQAREIAALRDELERERMRLVACGVVAYANTPEAAKERRKMHPDYWSASCADVARAVDREMGLRAEIAELRLALREGRMSVQREVDLTMNFNPNKNRELRGTMARIDAALEMSGGVK